MKVILSYVLFFAIGTLLLLLAVEQWLIFLLLLPFLVGVALGLLWRHRVLLHAILRSSRSQLRSH
jgi:hypothetical protein